MICRCVKDYRMSWAGHSLICKEGKDYRCKMVGREFIFLDFIFLQHYEGFPVPDLAFHNHFLDISIIREQKINQIL